jgi:hypothetical protein
VAQARESGLPGVDLFPGDHVCAMFFGRRERDDIVVPYLEAGLRAGDKCICIVDAPPLDDLAASIGDEREIEGYIASEQLELLSPVDLYLRVSPFSSESMIEWWQDSLAAATSSGIYRFSRATGEMPGEWQSIARAEWFRYESELNRFLKDHPETIICLYDLDRFGGGFMIDLLRTHPKLLMGGLLLENPHWRPPGSFVPAGAPRRRQPSSGTGRA